MNFCNRSEEVLDYVIGSMEPDRRSSFENHLATCRACSDELAIERGIEVVLRESSLHAADLDERIAEAIRLIAKPPRPRLRVARTLAWSAAAAVMVGAAWLLSMSFFESLMPSGAMGEITRALTQLTSSAGANLGTLITAGTLTAAAFTIAAVLPGE